MINEEHITFKKEPFFKIAKNFIKLDTIVLDIGAGNGSFSEYCSRNDFYLFESNENTVSYLKKKNKNVFQGALPKLPFENEFFELIHCSHVVEHLNIDVFYNTLKEMDRCLKKGGRLVISAPLMWEGFYNDLSHIKPYNPNVFINYLCKDHSNQRTKKQVATVYKMLSITYRFRETNSFKNLKNTEGNLMVKVFLKFINYLEKKGLKDYEKTGFTIVLQK